jgi:phosphate transport system protein
MMPREQKGLLMPKPHTVRSYDQELDRVRREISEMGKACLVQVGRAIAALDKRDGRLADLIVEEDQRVDGHQKNIDQMIVKILATRQPMAFDLRHIVSSLKISADLERIADYASNIARHVKELNHAALEAAVGRILLMAQTAEGMLQDVLNALERLDSKLAVEVWKRDREIDTIYSELLSELRNIMANRTDSVQTGTSLLFIGRCCERIGDHITNVAESVYYIDTGKPMDEMPH